MADSYIGKKIAELRKKRNLSIRELAEKAGVTSSLLSQIERGLANPSLNTLKIIAKVLDEPMFSFFIPAVVTEDLVLRENKRKRIVLPENQKLEYQLLSPDLSGNIEMILLKLPPHHNSSEEPVKHKGEEIVYVIEGELSLYIDNKTITLNNGDSVKILPYMKHQFKNRTDRDAVIIFAVSPPSF